MLPGQTALSRTQPPYRQLPHSSFIRSLDSCAPPPSTPGHTHIFDVLLFPLRVKTAQSSARVANTQRRFLPAVPTPLPDDLDTATDPVTEQGGSPSPLPPLLPLFLPQERRLLRRCPGAQIGFVDRRPHLVDLSSVRVAVGGLQAVAETRRTAVAGAFRIRACCSECG